MRVETRRAGLWREIILNGGGLIGSSRPEWSSARRLSGREDSPVFTAPQNERLREIAERAENCRKRVRQYNLMSQLEQDRDDLYDLLKLTLIRVESLNEQLAMAEGR